MHIVTDASERTLAVRPGFDEVVETFHFDGRWLRETIGSKTGGGHHFRAHASMTEDESFKGSL